MSAYFNFYQFYLDLRVKFFYFPALRYTLYAFYLVLAIFSIGLIVRFFWRKRRRVGANFYFVIALVYFMCDILLCMSIISPRAWQSSQLTIYCYCLLKFAILIVIYAIMCLLATIYRRGLLKGSRNHAVNSLFVANQKRENAQNLNDCGERGLCDQSLARAPTSVLAGVCEGVECAKGAPSHVGGECLGKDANIGYFLKVIQAVEQKGITGDEREFLQDLKFKVRQIHSFLPEQTREVNRGLEKLVKLMAKYEVS